MRSNESRAREKTYGRTLRPTSVFRGPPCPNCGSERWTKRMRPDDSWITFGGHDANHDLHRCLRCFASFSPESDESG